MTKTSNMHSACIFACQALQLQSDFKVEADLSTDPGHVSTDVVLLRLLASPIGSTKLALIMIRGIGTAGNNFLKKYVSIHHLFHHVDLVEYESLTMPTATLPLSLFTFVHKHSCEGYLDEFGTSPAHIWIWRYE